MIDEPIVAMISQYMYINETIMIHALNLYSGACQLFLNKTGKKRTKIMHFEKRKLERPIII